MTMRGALLRHQQGVPTTQAPPPSTTPDIGEAIKDIEKAQALLDAALVALQGTPPVETPIYGTAIQDRDPRAKPALPALGPAGSTFVDPTFNTRITRVTDAQTAEGASWRVASNVHLAAWSADAALFYVIGSAGKRVFRNTNGVVARVSDITSQCEPTWSRAHVNKIWVVGGSATRTIQVTTVSDQGNTTVDVLNLDHLGLPDLVEPRTYVGGMVSGDDALAVFFGGRGQDDHHYAAVLREGETSFAYMIDTLTEPALIAAAGVAFRLHSISIDRTGRFVVLYPVGAKPHHVVIWDTANGSFAPLTNQMAPWGHDTQGYGWAVNHDCSPAQDWDAAQWQIRPLDSLNNHVDLIAPVLRPKVTYMDDHASWHNARPDRLMPVITATYRFNNESAEWRAWDEEIIAIATDGPSLVYRFCHHRSDASDEQDSADVYFWYQPLASVSPDGKWVIFHSNWEKTLGADPRDAGRSRQDVFLVELPG